MTLEARAKRREKLVKLAKDSVVERASKLYISQYRVNLEHLKPGDQVEPHIPVGKDKFVDWVKMCLNQFFPEVSGATDNEKILKEYAVQIAQSIAQSNTEIQNPMRDYEVSKDPIYVRANRKVYVKTAQYMTESNDQHAEPKVKNLWTAPTEHSRYCPDHPGSMMRRVSDNVYQCPIGGELNTVEPWKEKYSYTGGHEVKFETGVQNQTAEGWNYMHPVLPFLTTKKDEKILQPKGKEYGYEREKLYGVKSPEFPFRQSDRQAESLLRKITKVAEDRPDNKEYIDFPEKQLDAWKGQSIKTAQASAEQLNAKIAQIGKQPITIGQHQLSLRGNVTDMSAFGAGVRLDLRYSSNQTGSVVHAQAWQGKTLADLPPLEQAVTQLQQAAKQKLMSKQQSSTRPAKTAQYNEKFFGETTIMTRQCPDHPGQQLARIEDNVRQCPLDNKIYDFERGFETEDGVQHSGGSVNNQHSIPPGSIIIKREAGTKKAQTLHPPERYLESINLFIDRLEEMMDRFAGQYGSGAHSVFTMVYDLAMKTLETTAPIAKEASLNKKAQASDAIHGFLYTHVLPYLGAEAEYARRVLNYKFSKPGMSLEQAILDIKKADELAAAQKEAERNGEQPAQPATAQLKGFARRI